MIGIGDVINQKYRLVRLLGDGGMGSVYEATHEGLGTRVAIKLLHPELARRAGLVERFLQEARVAAQIRSPHVVQVLDVDRVNRLGAQTAPPNDSQAFIVMELLEGEPLSAFLDRRRQLQVTLACEYTTQILEALEAAHALGVIHRDLKPENVFVTHVAGKTVIKLIDFGIAKLRRTDARNLTVAGVVMGTAEYMPPEQARSADRADARSDIYAVGVMLYEMIAGTRPALGEDARIVAAKVERGEVTPLVRLVPDVPRELAGLVHRAMAARPELRFASATEMRLALASALGARRTGLQAAQAPSPAGTQQASAYGPTAPLPAVPAMLPPRSVSPPPHEGRNPTVQGAPAQAVLAAGIAQGNPYGGAQAMAMGPSTALRATPVTPEPHMAPAHFGPMGGMPMSPAYTGVSGPAAPRRGRGAGLFVLVLLPLTLGIGVVIALVASGQNPFTTDDPTMTNAPATHTASEPLPPATSPTQKQEPSAVAPLTPGPQSPPAHTTGPASTRPTTQQQDASTPLLLPTGFPSAFPLPDGGLFPIPTAFPTALPSGFPTAFPTWPPPPPPPQ